MNTGKLIVQVYANSNIEPVNNALVEIFGNDISKYTDINGMTEEFIMEAPPIENSEIPGHEDPYYTYDIRITKTEFIPFIIKGVEIFPDVTSRQEVILTSVDDLNVSSQELEIEPPVLNGDYAPTMNQGEEIQTEKKITSSRVLSQVIIPKYIIVHDGVPSNTSGANYRMSFIDYIKNVACCEIYPTWPKETIKANVAVIISFTLNRVYTEWYSSKGFDFTITSVTAYDQKYTYGRTTFESITRIVDEYFNQYINFPGREEPFLAYYNDGIKTNKEKQLSQWESQTLGVQGYSAINILKHYYGNNLTLKIADQVEGLPESYHGHIISIGACEKFVQEIQNQLNVIRGNYPGIPRITKPNGEYDQETLNVIIIFQKVFGLAKTGSVDYATFYKISLIYIAVKKLTASITT